jgi:endonuclease/exonuclease/phosphatase family metal-dependent hydrolase
MTLPRWRLRIRAASLVTITLAIGLSLSITGCDSTDGPDASADVTVMSYNVYLGADIFDLVGAPPEQIPLIAAQLFAQVQATNFPARATAIASIVAEHDPALIGLQEVTLYRTQSPSDYVQGVTEPNAQDVAIDFLQILMDALAAEGLNYRVVANVTNADVELPSTTDGQNFTDIRLTDRDVILARADVTTTNRVDANFSAEVTAPIPVGGMTIPFTRGYNHVRATVDGVSFTFANTHLEVQVAGDQQPQVGQAFELMQALNSLPQPIVLVGDFNSPPDGSGTIAYSLVDAQFTDAVTEVGPQEPTCCQAANLLNETSQLTSRIDLIFYRGNAQPLSTVTVGNRQQDRINGLWPSDHAGVVATLRINN